MLCCPRSVSLCRMQLPEARFDLPLRRGLGTEGQSWLRGHGWDLGAEAFRAPNPAFPTKENMLGVGFGCRRPPAKQQGPRSQRQPSPASPYAERRAGGENRLRCFPELRRLGVVVCCQGEFPFAGCSSKKLVLGCHCDRTSALSGRAGSGGMDGAWAQNTFAHPILHPKEGEPVGSGFRALETPSKAAVHRRKGERSSAAQNGERGAGGEKRKS